MPAMDPSRPPSETPSDPSHPIGRVNLGTASGEQPLLPAILLGAVAVILMVGILLFILTNVFRVP